MLMYRVIEKCDQTIKDKLKEFWAWGEVEGEIKQAMKREKRLNNSDFKTENIVPDRKMKKQRVNALYLLKCLKLNVGNRHHFAAEDDMFPSKGSSIIRKHGMLIGYYL